MSTTLRALSMGVVDQTRPSTNAGGISGLASNANPANTQQVQVAPPVQYDSVNLEQVNDNADGEYQSNFRNATGATQNMILGGMFSLPGQYQYFNLTPSAVDFATFQDIGGTAYPANAGTFQSLAQRIALLPAVINAIWLQSNMSTQSSQNLKQGYITKSLDIRETTVYTSMCDACDNNNTTLYTKKFIKAFPVGKNNYVKIPVVNMPLDTQFVTVRIGWEGEAQSANLTATF